MSLGVGGASVLPVLASCKACIAQSVQFGHTTMSTWHLHLPQSSITCRSAPTRFSSVAAWPAHVSHSAITTVCCKSAHHNRSAPEVSDCWVQMLHGLQECPSQSLGTRSVRLLAADATWHISEPESRSRVPWEVGSCSEANYLLRNSAMDDSIGGS